MPGSSTYARPVWDDSGAGWLSGRAAAQNLLEPVAFHPLCHCVPSEAHSRLWNVTPVFTTDAVNHESHWAEPRNIKEPVKIPLHEAWGPWGPASLLSHRELHPGAWSSAFNSSGWAAHTLVLLASWVSSGLC